LCYSRKRRNPRPDSGIGLAEVLIALVIFSTAILGIVGTAARVGAIVNSSHVRLGATTLATRQLETLLSMPYDSVASGTVERGDVEISWAVTQTAVAKHIVLVYRYDLTSGVREDTLTAAVLKP
jgi:Tfp pilus assembly protein PilV